MAKIAFIYPGQGSQKIGMGKDFYENSEISKNIFDKASEELDMDLTKLCFEENEYINNTKYTQPALVTTCLAMTRELMAENIRPDITAGLSLGEYAAIAAAGGILDIDAIKLVGKRGKYMDEAAGEGKGMMAAVLGMETEAIEEILKPIGGASIANYNCPGQIVITGEKEAVKTAIEKLNEAGARKVIELNVSGPFHSKFLEPAGKKLAKKLENVEWKKLDIPYVTNVDAAVVDDITQTKDLLTKQVSSSVCWEQSIRNMIDMGVDTFVEIGPGRTLTGFLKKIDRSVTALNVATMEDVKALKEKLC